MSPISLPDELKWYHWHAWAALLQSIVGAALWNAHYIQDESAGSAASRLSDITADTFGPEVSLALSGVVLFGILGAPYYAARGHWDLRKRGSPDLTTPVMAGAAVGAWPLQWVAVFWHLKDHRSAPEPEDSEWKFEVSEA